MLETYIILTSININLLTGVGYGVPGDTPGPERIESDGRRPAWPTRVPALAGPLEAPEDGCRPLPGSPLPRYWRESCTPPRTQPSGTRSSAPSFVRCARSRQASACPQAVADREVPEEPSCAGSSSPWRPDAPAPWFEPAAWLAQTAEHARQRSGFGYPSTRRCSGATSEVASARSLRQHVPALRRTVGGSGPVGSFPWPAPLLRRRGLRLVPVAVRSGPARSGVIRLARLRGPRGPRPRAAGPATAWALRAQRAAGSTMPQHRLLPPGAQPEADTIAAAQRITRSDVVAWADFGPRRPYCLRRLSGPIGHHTAPA